MLLRFVISAATAGFCNPCVSLIEDIIVFILTPLALLVGIAAIIIGVFVLIAFVITTITKIIRKCTHQNAEDETFNHIIGAQQIEPKPWVDDSLQLICYSCLKSFDFTTRKHHCRWCGNIFCDECTQKTCSVPTLKDKQRVCNRCYYILTYPPPPTVQGWANQFSEKTPFLETK
jgi:hypothetical protein